MSDEHDHSHHDHDHGHAHPAPASGAPVLPDDAGSQALSEALGSSFIIIRVLMVVLLVLFVFSGVFIVGPQEKAVVLHLGKPVGLGNQALLGPGIHLAWPNPIDEVVRIKIAQIQQVTSTAGWFFTAPEMVALGIDPPGGMKINPAQDSYVITGDTNIIHTKATLHYSVEDPIRFEFDFANGSNAVQNALDSALLYVAARYKADDALTRDVAGFQNQVQIRVKELVRERNLGIVVEQCQVQSRPPLGLKQVFESVNIALSTRDQARNNAKSYENEVVSQAQAEAASRVSAAEAESVRLVQAVKAEAQRFTDVLPQYQANPALFVNLLLTETISKVLTNVQDKIYLPERADGKTRELRLMLSREPVKPAAPTGRP